MNIASKTPTMVPAVAPETAVRVNLPKPIYDRYAAAARQSGVEDVELYIRQQLISCVDYDQSSASLHFNASQSHRLCDITGRGTCNDPEKILDRLERGSTVKIGNVVMPLDADLKERISHNYLVRKNKMTAEEFILREAVNGVRQSVGLSRKPL